MRIMAMTKYPRVGASSRLRTYQYVNQMHDYGLDIDVYPFFDDEYMRTLLEGRKNLRSLFKNYVQRIRNLFFKASDYDLIWIEKELFPYTPSIFEYWLKRIGKPYIVDFDDAIFHRYDQHNRKIVRNLLGKKIDRVMKHASGVVCGNNYLKARARSAGSKDVIVVPTVIDLERYDNELKKSHVEKDPTVTIGWIGSPTTSEYLLDIEDALFDILENMNCKLVLIGSAPTFKKIKDYTFVKWSESSEVQDIAKFDVGIMPVPNDKWSMGKCGYKLLQYMACYKPVLATPVGVNKHIVENGVNGFLCDNSSDWKTALEELISNKNKRIKFGQNGRKKVENQYSLNNSTPELAAFIKSKIK